MKCQHCKRNKAGRPRGLCWTCYYTPSISGLYPSTSKHRQRNFGEFNGGYKLPPEPTTAHGQTPEKVEVLCLRAELGCALWHPLDAGYLPLGPPSI